MKAETKQSKELNEVKDSKSSIVIGYKPIDDKYKGIQDIPKEQKEIRNIVNNIYDLQNLRIAIGNRLVSAVNLSLGILKNNETEGEIDEVNDKMINLLKKDYQRLTDLYADNKELVTQFGSEERITNLVVYNLVKQYLQMFEMEADMVKNLEMFVNKHPIWTTFLKDVKGCGPLMAGIILSYFNIHRARHISSFWAYAGIDTVRIEDDETGEVKRVGHTRQHVYIQEYFTKSKEIETKKSIGYNPVLKTKLLGVLAGGMLKAREYEKNSAGINVIDELTGKRKSAPSYYAKLYYDYKDRAANDPVKSKLSPMHVHRQAIRWMIREFLRDLWLKWRELENLPISQPYEVEKLNRAPHAYNNNHVIKANQYPITSKGEN